MRQQEGEGRERRKNDTDSNSGYKWVLLDPTAVTPQLVGAVTV